MSTGAFMPGRTSNDERLRFCCTNVCHFGQTFLDLSVHAAAHIRANMVIDYEAPDPRNAAFARCITNIALPKQTDRVELFLAIFNSDWSRRTLKHHCSLTCKCGGLSPPALAQLAATLWTEIIMCKRPPVPALSRWLRCADTARWFVSLAKLSWCFVSENAIYVAWRDISCYGQKIRHV